MALPASAERMPIRASLAARGYSLARYVRRMCNARNGNAHNPTPQYTWVLLFHGTIVDSASTRRALLADFEGE